MLFFEDIKPKIKYVVGIDQSLSNTGLTVLNLETKEIEKIISFKTALKLPDFDNALYDFYEDSSRRVSEICSFVLNELKAYKGDETIVGVEYLASGSSLSVSKSKDTDYILSYLFFTLMSSLKSGGYIFRFSVTPSNHKKAFFPKVQKKKIKLYEDHWDESFMNSGFTLGNNSFKNLDEKDSFCVAYFFSLVVKYSKENIFMKRTNKEKDTIFGRKVESVKTFLCLETKKSKKCWTCPLFLTCKDGKKYRKPKTKKEKEKFEELQKLC